MNGAKVPTRTTSTSPTELSTTLCGQILGAARRIGYAALMDDKKLARKIDAARKKRYRADKRQRGLVTMTLELSAEDLAFLDQLKATTMKRRRADALRLVIANAREHRDSIVASGRGMKA